MFDYAAADSKGVDIIWLTVCMLALLLIFG